MSFANNMRVFVEYTPAPNIGDGFYQSTLLKILSRLCPHAKIIPIDGPTQRCFKLSNSSILYKNVFDIRKYFSADLWVFSGPILGAGFTERYAPIIEKITKSGGKYMLLSVAAPHICNHWTEIKKILYKYPPIAFSSRSQFAYERYGNTVDDSYNGVCTAFFSSLVFDTPISNIEKNIACSIYSRLEPTINFKIKNENIEYDSVCIKEKKTIFWRYLRHSEWVYTLPKQINGYRIIRPVHDLSYKFSHLNFGKPNSFISYDPYAYFSLYSKVDLTVSDRVHACVVTLSYGNPAVLVGQWDRADLFSRMNIKKQGTCMLPPGKDKLQQEYIQFTDWLRRRLGYCVA